MCTFYVVVVLLSWLWCAESEFANNVFTPYLHLNIQWLLDVVAELCDYFALNKR